MNVHKNPEIFHQNFYKMSSKCYFEGWYYKQVTADGKNTVSFIPGVSFEGNNKKGFIQCLYRNKWNELKAYNIDYPINKFTTRNEPFGVRIGDSKFSLDNIAIDIKEQALNVRGNIKFGELTPIKTSLISPNIMGFFSYIPLMECNHGVLSMGHKLKGVLEIEGEEIDFTGGTGYIEKDWGRSFPSKYMWIQSNHFDQEKVGFFCSVATIPFVAFSFTGFICNLHHNNKEYRFATYNGTKLVLNKQSDEGIHLIFKNSKYSLEIKGKMKDSKKLLAPKMGAMDKMIKEGLSGSVKIILRDKQGSIVLVSTSHQCGMEVVNQLENR